MTVKKGKDLGLTWACTCGKWNFGEAKVCWACHEPKIPPVETGRRGRPKKEIVEC